VVLIGHRRPRAASDSLNSEPAQPPLSVQSSPSNPTADEFATETAPATLASDSLTVLNGQNDARPSLPDIDDSPSEHRLHRRKASWMVPELLLQSRLSESVAPRKTVRLLARLDL
jgi:hypothetical protein